MSNYKIDGTGNEHITQFKWLTRMSMYVEGTSRGLLKVKDIQKGGEALMYLPTDFKETERIQLFDYNQEKNVIFASSRDGGFRIWKLHHEWRSKHAERSEYDIMQEHRKADQER